MKRWNAAIREISRWALAPIAMLVFLPTAARAQAVWAVADNGTTLSAGAHTIGAFSGPCDVPIPPPNAIPLVGLVPGMLGHALGLENIASCREVGSCVLSATGDVRMFVDGIGTPNLRIHFDAISQTHHSCFGVARAYTGNGIANLVTTLGLTPVGLPAGTPVTVHFAWWAGSTNNYHPEAAAEDTPTRVFGTTMTLNGAPLFAGGFLNLVNIRGAGFTANTVVDPQIATTVGVPLAFGATFNSDVFMTNPGNPPPPGTLPQDDDELTSYLAEIDLSLTGPLIQPQSGEIDFSTDMGSDTSLAPAPPPNANETFDPGDMYPMGGPALPVGGADGVRDDATINIGADPRPVCPGAPIADVCSGLALPPVDLTNYDVDGSDSLDPAMMTTLASLLAMGPLPFPMSATDCVRRGDFLLLSFDDDTTSHVYDAASCSAPAASQSPRGMTYGSAAVQDEVVGADIVEFAGSRFAATYPFASESQVHVSLAPNPAELAALAAQGTDDDVDALDERAPGCSVWLFSVDHEANFGLDPGIIYQPAGGVAVPVVLEGSLGLGVGVDIRDFEFAITSNPAGVDTLTLLFTVAPDDPLTGANESAGLDPSMIYASYLNGTFFPYLSDPIPLHGFFGPIDGIDGLTTIARPFSRGAGDSDGDGVADVQDCRAMDPTVWSAPSSAPQNVSMDHTPSTNTATLSWTSPATPGGTALVYDVFRAPMATTGALPPVFACRAPDVNALSILDSVMPPAGTAYLYLLRAQTVCGNGPVGTSAGGHTPAVPLCP